MGQGRTQIALLVLVLAVGLGAGFVAGMIFSEPEPATETRRPGGGGAEAAANVPADPKPPVPKPASPEGRPEPAVPPRDEPDPKQGPGGIRHPDPARGSLRERMAHALEGYTVPALETGNGQITGTITEEESGKPLAGVLVEAWGSPVEADSRTRPQRDPPTAVQPGEPPNPVEAAVRTVSGMMDRPYRYYHATTGADGSYALTGLPESRKYRMAARSVHYALSIQSDTASRRPSRHEARPGDTVNFTGKRQWHVAFEVETQDGSPAAVVSIRYGELNGATDRAGAEAMAASVRLNTNTSISGAGDYLTFEPGFYALAAELEGDSSLMSADTMVVHVGEGGDQKVVIRLRSVPGVIVKVRDESGGGRDHGVDFYCMPWTGEAPPTHRELQNYERRNRTNRAYERKWLYDFSRPVVLKDLEPGRHVAVLESRDRIVAHAFFEPSNTVQEIVMVIPPPAREEYIVVWVKDPSGEPIRKGVDFRLQAKWGNGSSSRGGSGTITPEGWWRLPHFPDGDGPKNRADAVWTVTVTHDRWGSATGSFAMGPASELTLQFQEVATVEVVVDGLATHPAKALLGASITPFVEGNDSWGNDRSLLASPNGFSATAIQPGKYSVTLSLTAGDHDSLELQAQTVTVAPGANTVRFQIPALYSLTISVPASEPDTSVWLSQSEDTGSTVAPARRRYFSSLYRSTNQQKQVVFEYLPAGRYSVSVSSNGVQNYSSQEISLPGPALVTMTPR